MCHCVNKLVLVIVNIVFFLAGAAIMGVAIWVIASKNTLFQVVHIATQGASVNDAVLSNYENSTSTLLAAAYVVLAFGAISFVIGFCGCCGAIRESSCLLMVYAGAISVILLVEIAGGIAAAVFKTQIDKELRPTLTSLENKRFLPIHLAVQNNSEPNAVFTSLINYAQTALGCCGISGIGDITGNTTLWYNSTRVYDGKTLVRPVTCCKMNMTEVDKLLLHQNWNNATNYLVDPNCPYNSSSSAFYEEGCYEKLNSYIDRYTVAIIIVGIIVGLFEIICVIMACSMIQKIRNEGKQSV